MKRENEMKSDMTSKAFSLFLSFVFVIGNLFLYLKYKVSFSSVAFENRVSRP